MAGAVRDQRTRGPYAAMDRSTPIDRHVLGALDWRAGRVFTEAVSDPASVPFEAFQCTNEEVVASDLEQGGVEIRAAEFLQCWHAGTHVGCCA